VPTHEEFMQMALELAEQSGGHVAPNPLVGALLVKNGRIVGKGFHANFGGPHAEVEAINDAGSASSGSTIYVNLEPCCHHGKTPPCTSAIQAAGILQVVYGTRDRNPEARGGLEILRQAGIDIIGPILDSECRDLNAAFFKHTITGRPLVLAKWAMTIDGKIATHSGKSRWISSEASRKFVHEWRGKSGAILIGRRTAQIDDPYLDCRLEGFDDPIKVILDSNCTLSPQARMFEPAIEGKGNARVIIFTSKEASQENIKALSARGAEVIPTPCSNGHISIPLVLEELGKRGINLLMVEGGGEVLGSFFDGGFIDRALIFISPKIVGGRDAMTPVAGVGLDRMSDAHVLRDIHNYRLGDDLVIEGKLGDWSWCEKTSDI
jgi:diaminohydroxyphosphoribosylaminopyrimidine deaminase / 5-amino-6-(5-phosphoribosylamino)uracil reductase